MIYPCRCLLLFVFFAGCCAFVCGQHSAQNFPQPILFESKEFEYIFKIEEDNNGFVWLATNRGLFCFDGAFFRKVRYAKTTFSAIDEGQISDIFLDREKEELWLATHAGASRLDLKTETFADYILWEKGQPDKAGGICKSVFKDRRGDVWFGVMGFGLVKLDTALHYFPMPPDAGHGLIRDYPTIYQIDQDAAKDSILWLAFNLGLARFNTATGEYTFPARRPPDGTLVSLNFTALFPTKDKVYLGSTWRDGGTVYDISKRTFRPLDYKNPHWANLPMKLGVFQPRSPTTIWGATDDGIVAIDTRNDSVTDFFPSRFNTGSESKNLLGAPGHLWLGCTEGLLLYDFRRYTVENHYFVPDADGSPDILHCVLEKEEKNRFWLGFTFSKFIYDYDRASRRFEAIPRHPKSRRWAPANLMRLNDGRLLAAGDGGIFEVRGGRLVHLPLLEDLFAAKMQLGFCVQDREGYLWVNSRFDGFYKVDVKTGQYRDCLKGRYLNGTPLAFCDSRGNFWLSGRGFSVYYPQKDSLFRVPYRPGEPMTADFPRDFEEDDEGNIWLSDIRVGGLMMVDPEHPENGVIRRFEAQNGSLSNKMWALKKDRRGRIWAVTQAGLQMFDPQKGTFRLFGEAVGLQVMNEEIGDGFNLSLSCLELLTTGEMLLGYRHGFAIFHPDSLTENRELPKPYLISVKANEQALFEGNSFGLASPLRLEHDQNVVEFEFSGIAFFEPKKIVYRYRLKGYEENWAETDRRYVRYTQLPPGRYSFQLLALNSDGHYAELPLEWRFQVLPPWWRTWWAYVLYFSLTVAALRAAYNWRKRRWQLKAQLDLEHREAERLKELDAVKTRLYTNITHEFRTPLTVILGMARQVLDNPKEHFRYGLDMIIRNGQNLLNLVNQMLDLSKLESGKLSLHPQQGDVVNFLKYLAESFHSLAKSKNVRIHFLNDIETLTMDFDAERLQQVVSNLLSNAIKFTPEGGQVYFSLSSDSNSGKGGSNQTLVIKVKDTGVGIPEEHLANIFDRFYQVGDSHTRHGEGTGIGLALVKELVKLMDGGISVHSTAGKGTEFTVTLPVLQTAEMKLDNGNEWQWKSGEVEVVSPASYIANQASAEKPLVLIAEDNADVVAYLASCLSGDYRLAIAKDGRECETMAFDIIPDLIVTDVMMPRKDGFEVCEVLKKDERTSHIPIIMLTAKADADSKLKGLGHGADAYLMKPFHKEELMIRIRKLLELRQQLQQHYLALAGLREGSDPQNDVPACDVEHAFVQKVRAVVEAHLDDYSFTVEILCKEVCLSHPQLHRKLSALTGISANKFIRSVRLNKAKSLLLNPELSITAVAFYSGFSDPGYFSKIFKQEFGLTPLKWREQHGNAAHPSNHST
ncbi:MAG: hybrid sensor histidine kinase/response regulator [Haliscomenobacteraceae bacterium CHB4]|nr:Sensor histidine kinase RcsC [Saprospiraceae bacterium]MCE7925171.1 hybrid sensor histidine kinase/response regulator [Haliscomenobacteraceae bacterium CHB4]